MSTRTKSVVSAFCYRPSHFWLYKFLHHVPPTSSKSAGCESLPISILGSRCRGLWTHSAASHLKATTALPKWNRPSRLAALANNTPLSNQCFVKSIHIDRPICFNKQTLVLWKEERTSLPSHMISDASTLSPNEYEEIVEDTLHSLNEYFDEILDKSSLTDCDAFYSDGVLTIKIGPSCTYVINKQTPNKQVWLSSPFSGPKRYDFENQTWIYKHDNLGTSLHGLLNEEIPKVVTGVSDIDFVKNCSYGKVIRHQSD